MGSQDLLRFVKSRNALKEQSVYEAVLMQWTTVLLIDEDHARWFLDEYTEAVERLIERGGRLFREKLHCLDSSELIHDAWYVNASPLLEKGCSREDIEVREVGPGVVSNAWANIWLGPAHAHCFIAP